MMLFTAIRPSTNLMVKRFIRKKILMKSWPNDWVPFVWNRPVQEPGYLDSADLVGLGDPDKAHLIPEIGSSKLRTMDIDHPMRKIFSVDHAKRVYHNKAQVHEHLKKLGLIHEYEYKNSLEAKIVNLTYFYRELISRLGTDGGATRYNGHIRSMANSLKYRRYRYLCTLKELNEDRYERIIKALNLEPKNNPINVPFLRPYRKKQMRRLAIEYALELKEKKVEEFMKSLEKEKEEFQKYKTETLNWIEEKEKELGISV